MLKTLGNSNLLQLETLEIQERSNKELPFLSFFPTEVKGVPGFDLTPFLLPGSACLFVQFHVWILDFPLWCPWNISHLRKSVGGNGSELVRISRSKDYRNLPRERVCTQAGLYKGLESQTLDICKKSSYLKIMWLLYIVWHSITLWIQCSFELAVLCWTHTGTGLHYVLQMLRCTSVLLGAFWWHDFCALTVRSDLKGFLFTGSVWLVMAMWSLSVIILSLELQ